MQPNENDKPGKDGKFPDERANGLTQKKISRRDLLFVENLLLGKSAAQAARDAGYRASVANGKAGKWVGESPERSTKPHLWEYFQERRKIQLRLFDVTVDSIVNELKIISFATLDKFIHFPTKDDYKLEQKKADYEDALSRSALNIATPEDLVLIDEVTKENPFKNYRPGSFVRLKAIEDIPKELIPAIAEIQETKDGIKVKLFSKLEAIEKLAKYLKMFSDNGSQEAGSLNVQELNIIVNGTKSPLMQLSEKAA